MHKSVAAGLDAEGAAAAAGALHIRVIELEPGALDGLNVVDLHSVEIHLAHLVYKHLQAVELIHIVGRILLTIEGHVVAKTGASSTATRRAVGAGSCWFMISLTLLAAVSVS